MRRRDLKSREGDTADGYPGLPSLKKSIGFASFSRLYQAVTQFAVIALTARLAGVEAVGLLTLSAAIVTPLFFLASMGMHEVRMVDDQSEFRNVDYMALRMSGGIGAIVLAAAIVLLGYGTADLTLQITVVAFALLRFFWAQSGLVHAMCQARERLDLVAASVAIRCTLGLFVFALVLWQSGSLATALLAEAASAFAVYLLVDQRLLVRIGAGVARSEVFSVRAGQVVRLLLWTLPLGMALWFGRATVSAPPIVLEREAGLAAVGLFGALAYAHTGLAMVATGFQNATAARLRRYYASGDGRAFWTLTGKLALGLAVLGGGVLLVSWSLGDPILTLAFGPEYADRALLTVIVGGSSLALLGTPFLTVISSAHAFRVRLAVSAAAFSGAVLAAVLLVPDHGAMGAAWAMVCGFATQLCGAVCAAWLLSRSM